MVRDSRTPGTYTVSVFTKAVVRYGANCSAKWRETLLKCVSIGVQTTKSDSARGRGSLEMVRFPSLL